MKKLMVLVLFLILAAMPFKSHTSVAATVDWDSDWQQCTAEGEAYKQGCLAVGGQNCANQASCYTLACMSRKGYQVIVCDDAQK